MEENEPIELKLTSFEIKSEPKIFKGKWRKSHWTLMWGVYDFPYLSCNKGKMIIRPADFLIKPFIRKFGIWNFIKGTIVSIFYR